MSDLSNETNDHMCFVTSTAVDASSPLKNCRFQWADASLASHYAAALLSSLGAVVEPLRPPARTDAAIDWARSGLMPLTGLALGPPLQGPGAIASCANGALIALRQVVGRDVLPGVLGSTLLSERAAFLNLTRQGATSANGSCRLLATGDGYLAINLARADDMELLPAWLQCPDLAPGWQGVADELARYSTAPLVARGRGMGLAVSEAAAPGSQAPPWLTDIGGSLAAPMGHKGPPLVVDLSSLWAGPLCSHLLQGCGARVIKVESTVRADGARRGSPAFFDLLNGGKASVALDLASPRGQKQLFQLIRRADIVIEGSRPRALRQMGIEAEELVASRPGLVWVSLTGYGRQAPQCDWVAFGDDAAVAAGIARWMGDPPLFCGDALADPLTGLHAALAAMAFWRAGIGALLDLSLYAVTAHSLGFKLNPPRGEVTEVGGQWFLSLDHISEPICAPRQRRSMKRAPALGADTKLILSELSLPC